MQCMDIKAVKVEFQILEVKSVGLCGCDLKENQKCSTVFTKERFDIKYALAEAAADKDLSNR